MYQILKNILAGMTIEERIEMLINIYEGCGNSQSSFIK